MSASPRSASQLAMICATRSVSSAVCPSAAFSKNTVADISGASADAILIASELAANAVLHSASAGEFFTVRCQAQPGHVWIEVQDLGGPWQPRPSGNHLHGLDIIQALAGPGNWGTRTTDDGDRIVWARLHLPGPTPR